MKLVNVGIVGYGVMGEMHAKIWSGIEGAELAAIVEPDQERQNICLAKYPACPVFSGIREMIEFDPKLDIMVIATHVPHHVVGVLRALAYGCHVICEKPMASTLLECDTMIIEAKQCNLKLAINHQSIFSRAVMVAKQKIVAGDIGELYAIKAYGKGRIACSDLMEIGGHLVHLTHYFASSDVTEVFGDVTYKGRPITVDDAVRVQLLYPEGRDSGIGAGDRMFGYYKFSNGIRGELHLDQLSGAPNTFGESRKFGYFIELCGTAGRMQLYLPYMLFFNASPSDDMGKNATPWVEVNPGLRVENDSILIERLIHDFLVSIKLDKEPVVSGYVGRIAMEMTLGIYASHLAGCPLILPLVDRVHPFMK